MSSLLCVSEFAYSYRALDKREYSMIIFLISDRGSKREYSMIIFLISDRNHMM